MNELTLLKKGTFQSVLASNLFEKRTTQKTFTFSKLAIEALEK